MRQGAHKHATSGTELFSFITFARKTVFHVMGWKYLSHYF